MQLKLATKTRNTVRELARLCVPATVYSRGARFYNDVRCRRVMDAASWRTFRTASRSLQPSTEATTSVKVATLLYPISIRPGTEDATELIHSAIREAYGKYLPSGYVQFVIDAGAYIGDASAWYLSRFPQATVVALEPNPDVYPILRANCAPYTDRAVALNAALWPSCAKLTLCANKTETGAFVKETGKGGVCGVSPIDLLDRYNPGGTIDIFKIDIEGAELELFTADCDSWLRRTRCIVMEIHGVAERAAVLAAMRRHSFCCERYRETYVFLRRDELRLALTSSHEFIAGNDAQLDGNDRVLR